MLTITFRTKLVATTAHERSSLMRYFGRRLPNTPFELTVWHSSDTPGISFEGRTVRSSIRMEAYSALADLLYGWGTSVGR
jgi:hypothetical protein